MKRTAAIFSLLSLILLGLTVLIIVREYSAPWRDFQEEYRTDLMVRADSQEEKIAAERFRVKVRQDWLPELDRADRCRTCHIGVADPQSPSRQPLASHPDITPHSFDRFGCTSCHNGDSYATMIPEAHDRLLPTRLIESSCIACHGRTGPGKEEAPTLDAGLQLLEEKRCFGCHLINGTEKRPPPAPPLDGLAGKVTPQWLSRWLHNPKDYLPKARMADFLLSENEIEAVNAFLLSRPLPVEAAGSFYSESETDEKWLAGLDDDQRDELIDRGKEVFGRSRCLSCHAMNGKGGDIGPDLIGIALKSNPRWLAAWLLSPSAYDPQTAMPTYRFEREERLAIVEYLLWESELAMEEFSEPLQGAGDGSDLVKDDPESVEEGRKLFLVKGCYNCHQLDEVKGPPDFAPKLADLADRPISRIDFGKSTVPHSLPEYVVAKLQNPRIYGEQLKMPFFGLEPVEVGRLASAVIGRSAEIPDPYRFEPDGIGLPAPKGEVGKIFDRYKCFSCHRMGERGGSLAPDLTFEGSKVKSEWLKKFMLKPYAIRPALVERMPRFNLTEKEVGELSDYARLILRNDTIDQAVPEGRGDSGKGRRLYFDTYNCQSCHSLKGVGGYYGPALEQVGERLQPSWLMTRLDDAHPYEPGSREPVLAIPPDERRELTAFMGSLEEKK